MNEASIGTYVIFMLMARGEDNADERIRNLVKYYDRAHMALEKTLNCVLDVSNSVECLSMSISDAVSTKGHPEHVETLVANIRTMAACFIEQRKSYLRWHRMMIDWLNSVDSVIDAENFTDLKSTIKTYLGEIDTDLLKDMISLLKMSEKFLSLSDDLEKATRKIKRHVPLSIWTESSLITELRGITDDWNKHLTSLFEIFDFEREQIYSLIGKEKL